MPTTGRGAARLRPLPPSFRGTSVGGHPPVLPWPRRRSSVRGLHRSWRSRRACRRGRDQGPSGVPSMHDLVVTIPPRRAQTETDFVRVEHLSRERGARISHRPLVGLADDLTRPRCRGCIALLALHDGSTASTRSQPGTTKRPTHAALRAEPDHGRRRRADSPPRVPGGVWGGVVRVRGRWVAEVVAELAGEPAAFGVGGDVEGAGGVLEVLVAQGAAPQVDAGFDGDVGPAAGGLGAVVAAAGGGEVARAGRSASSVGSCGTRWSQSHFSAGRKQNGKAQIRSRSWVCSLSRALAS